MEQVCCFIEVIELRNSIAKILSDGFQRDQLCHVPHKAVHLIGQAKIALALLFVGSGHTVGLCDHLAQLRRELCKSVAHLVKLRYKGSKGSRNLLTRACKRIKVSRFQLVGQVGNLPDRIESTAKSFKVRCVQNGQWSQSVSELSNASRHGVKVHAVQARHSRRNLLDCIHDRVNAFCACSRVDVGKPVQKAGDFVQP